MTGPDLTTEQPLPTPNDAPSVQSMVRDDLRVRERVGVARYGTPLQPHNGRDALRDAYEEALDLACYLRQALAEDTNTRAGELRAEGGVLGSSRRAQDEPVNLAEGPDAVVCRLAGELWRLGSGLAELGIPLDETVSVDQAPVTTALDALRARPSEPVPSQGQDIPDDQLDALSDSIIASGRPIFDATLDAIRQAYRVGFAAALGYEITIDQDGRVGVGDRLDCGHPIPADRSHVGHEHCGPLPHTGPVGGPYCERCA